MSLNLFPWPHGSQPCTLDKNIYVGDLKAHCVRVKYLIPNNHKKMSSTDSYSDFYQTYNIHQMFGKNVADMIVERVNELTVVILDQFFF